MIDWNKVVELRAESGSAAFWAQLETRLDEIEAALFRLGHDDADNLCRDLDGIQLRAGQLGFAAFDRLCAKMQGGDADGLAALNDCYARSKQLFMRDLPHAIGTAPGRIA